MSRELRYSKVSRRMWGDEKFRQLTKPTPNAQTLWFRLLTGPELGPVPGLFSAGEAGLAEALQWSVKGFRIAFAEIEALKLAEADWRARLVWVPKAIEHNEPESPNVVLSWAKAVKELPDSPLKARGVEGLRAHVEGMGEGFRKAFTKAFPKGLGEAFAPIEKALRQGSPNQEQEQEQEQEGSAKALPLGEGFPRWPSGLTGFEWVRKHFDEGRQRSGGQAYVYRASDFARTEAAVEWAEAAARTHGSPEAALRASLDGFFVNKFERDKGFKFAFWAADPGSFVPLRAVTAAVSSDPLRAELDTVRAAIDECNQANDFARKDELVKRRRELEDQIRAAATRVA